MVTTGREARELGKSSFWFDNSDDEFWSPEPAVGWRGWRWLGSRLRGMRSWWPSDVLVAECSFCRQVPGIDHTCGIYAVKPGYFNGYLAGGHIGVTGVVKLSGLVIEHERGYRAEVARITELWAPSFLVSPIQASYPSVEVHTAEFKDGWFMTWET
jgi:hypothetical protein